MNRYKKLVTNSGLIALGTFGSKLLSFFLIRFYTECMTPDEFGVADLIVQTAKLLMPLLALGIAETVFRFAMDKSCDKKQVFSAGIYTVGLGNLFYLLIVPILLLFNFLDGYTHLVVLYIFAANIHSLVTQYIRTKDHFAFYAVQGIINTAIVIGLNILFLAVLDLGVEGYVLSIIIADLVTTLIVTLKEKLWRDIVRPSVIPKGLLKDMFSYSIPLIPTTIMWWVTSASDRYIVTAVLGETANGIYSAAYKIPTLLVLLCTIFIQAWNFSSVSEENELERKRFFETVFSSFGAIMFIAASGVILLRKPIASLLFEAKYYSAIDLIPILSLATVFSCLVSFMGSVYTVKKKSTVALWTAIVGAATNVVLNFIFVPSELLGIKLLGLGSAGAAIATFASYFVVFVIRAINVKKHLPFNMNAPLLVINTLLVAGQIAITSFDIRYSELIQLPLVLAAVIINIKPLIRAVKKFLGK